MPRTPFDADALSEDEKKLLLNFEEKLKAWNEQQLLEAPEHIKRLGNIIRISVISGSLNTFGRFLTKHKVDVPESRLLQFRDYLITKRHDLRDLEPAARARLRLFKLKNDDRAQMSPDYQLALKRHEDLFCRDCRYFVVAPHDGTEGGDKACVEFGTKGADAACVGFTSKPS